MKLQVFAHLIRSFDMTNTRMKMISHLLVSLCRVLMVKISLKSVRKYNRSRISKLGLIFGIINLMTIVNNF